MGLRDWVFGRDDSALEAADRLRGDAMASPTDVDVERLVSVYVDADEHPVARSAAKGIEALGEQRPDRLVDELDALIEGIDSLDGVGARRRGQVASAIERVAAEVPDRVADHGDDIVATLERELEADETVGNGLYLDEQKVTALVEAVAHAEVESARPVLKRYRRHADPSISDAARDALRDL